MEHLLASGFNKEIEVKYPSIYSTENMSVLHNENLSCSYKCKIIHIIAIKIV